jgi:hypothetical protein
MGITNLLADGLGIEAGVEDVETFGFAGRRGQG